MSAVANKSELPAGWSEEQTVAGYRTYTKWVDGTNPWTNKPARLEKEISEPYFKMALVPPAPRFAVWQAQHTETSVEMISSWSTDQYYEVERPTAYQWVLLPRNDSGKVVADVSKLSSYVFRVDMAEEYPETGLQGFRDIRAFLLNK